MWEEKLKIYNQLVAKCDRFERKGKTMPYTSANGYMFSLLNKAGEIGIRFSKDGQKKYLKEFDILNLHGFSGFSQKTALLNPARQPVIR